MANKKKEQNLGYLGEETQITIVKNLIERKDFFLGIQNILDQNMFSFTNPSLSKLKDIVAILKDFYNERGIIPTYKEIGIIMNSRARSEFDIEENEELLKLLKEDKYYEGTDVAIEEAKSFFLRAACLNIGQKMSNGAFENKNIDNSFENWFEEFRSIRTGMDSTEESNPIDLMDKIYSTEPAEKVPTGIKEIDEHMMGGVYKRHTGLLIAGTGAGKTTFMSLLANGAALNEKKAIYFFFEETLEELGRKFIAANTGIYTKTMDSSGDYNLAKKLLTPQVKTALSKNLKLVRLRNGETTPDMIRGEITKQINKGFKPDVVFIDYFSCLKKTSNDNYNLNNECQAGERAMKKLSQMSQDFDIFIWIAEQTNRNGVKLSTAYDRLANVQGSFRITQPPVYCFYLDRVGKAMNKADLYLDKARECGIKEWTDITMNNGNLQIDMSDKIYPNENVSFSFNNDFNDDVEL